MGCGTNKRLNMPSVASSNGDSPIESMIMLVLIKPEE
jgi:hypothetical protein